MARRMFVKLRASTPAVYSSVLIHISVCLKSKFSFLIAAVAVFLQPGSHSFLVRGYGDRMNRRCSLHDAVMYRQDSLGLLINR